MLRLLVIAKMKTLFDLSLNCVVKSPRGSLNEIPPGLREVINLSWFEREVKNEKIEQRFVVMEEVLWCDLPRDDYKYSCRVDFSNHEWSKKVRAAKKAGVVIFKNPLLYEQDTPAATYIKLLVCHGTPAMDHYCHRRGGSTNGWYHTYNRDTYNRDTINLSLIGGIDHPFDSSCQSSIQTYPSKQKIRRLQALLLPLVRHKTTLEDVSSDPWYIYYYLGRDPLGTKWSA